MSQDYDIPLVGEYDGAEYAAKIKGTTDSLLTGNIGAGRPDYVTDKGTRWKKDVSSTIVEEYEFDGSNDIHIRTYDPTAHTLTETKLAPNQVTTAELQEIPTGRYLGRVTASTGEIELLTAAQLTAALNEFVGDSGSGGTKGLVPAPEPGDAEKILYGDGTWGPPASGMAPGTVAFTAAPAAPTGWILVYAQILSRATYSALYAEIGDTYGAGNGSTTFQAPDGRGYVIAGKDNMGGVAASRLTGLSGGVNGATLGAKGGEQAHTLTTPEIPAHTHTFTISTGDGASTSFPDRGNSPGTITGATSSVGGDQAHNNVQPTIVLNMIMKT